MSGMMSSPKRRSILGLDNPIDSDGFYRARHFKHSRRTGKSGGRVWRRILRAKEKDLLIKKGINW